MSDFARLDGAALDAHITGNYGEDQEAAAVTATLDRLHAAARRRHTTYAGAVADHRAYKAFADALAARLPFRWHPVGASNPYNNHQGGSYGKDHIVLDESVTVGRLHRNAGDALCKPARQFNGNLWVESDGPTCKRCLEIAMRIVDEASQ